jgi:hypothetical protein
LSRCNWIICERTGFWTAAIRMGVGREDWPPQLMPRIYEVRRMAELTARLEVHRNSLALVEADDLSFGDVLAWLSATGQSYPQARFAVLVARKVTQRRDWQLLVDSLREAGADDVVVSPRMLRGLLALGLRHAILQSSSDKPPIETMPIEKRLSASLPWQD